MIETLQKEINGSQYTVTQLPARRALRLQAKLMKMVGPALFEILDNAQKFDEKGNPIESDKDKGYSHAVELLMKEIDDKTFDLLVLDLLVGVRKEGVELTPSTVDIEYSGNLNEIYLVMQFVLEANFSDFFQENGILKKFLMK